MNEIDRLDVLKIISDYNLQITTEVEYKTALTLIDRYIDAKSNTIEMFILDLVSELVYIYEEHHIKF